MKNERIGFTMIAKEEDNSKNFFLILFWFSILPLVSSGGTGFGGLGFVNVFLDTTLSEDTLQK